MIAVDNTFLTLMLHPNARPPRDPSTNLPVTDMPGRVELLIDTLVRDRETIIIPTPVLAEFLILADKDGPQYLAEIDKKSLFRVESFDQKAAVELAIRNLEIRTAGGGRRGDMGGTYVKIAFDRQIVTIAKVNGAHTIYSDDEDVEKFADADADKSAIFRAIYSDDEDVEKFARRCEISVVKAWELPLPEPNLLSEIERIEAQTVEDKNEAVIDSSDAVLDTILPEQVESDAESESAEDQKPHHKVMLDESEE